MSMDLNVRSYDNKQSLLFPASIGDYLPPNHFAHVVDEIVDSLDLTSIYEKIPMIGNPSYHPALMTKIWFYGYATQTFSSRKIEENLHTDVAFIYLAGMQKPDFKTIAEFRKKHLEELSGLFVEILRICHQMGMTQLGEIALDSKVMKANASLKRTHNLEGLEQKEKEIERAISNYLERVYHTELEEDKKYGMEKRGNELPEELSASEKRLAKMKRILEELRQNKEKVLSSDKERINRTDPAAQVQKDKGRVFPGYRAQLAVDSREGVIVATGITGEHGDQEQLIPMVREILSHTKELKESSNKIECGENVPLAKMLLSADSGYSSTKTLPELSQFKEVDAYIPDAIYTGWWKRDRARKRDFDKDQFVYHSAGDYFLCPQDKKLQLEHSGQTGKLYRCKECADCPHFGDCTTSSKGRILWVRPNDFWIEQMRQKLKRPEGIQIYKRRKMIVEPVIGNLSQNLVFRQFWLRGLKKVRGEFTLMSIAHNLLKIARHMQKFGLELHSFLERFSPLPEPGG